MSQNLMCCLLEIEGIKMTETTTTVDATEVLTAVKAIDEIKRSEYYTKRLLLIKFLTQL
jgi:hypothetical protein